MDGAVRSVPEAGTAGWGGRQTAVLNFQPSVRAAVCTKKPKGGSGQREGSANKKQQHPTNAKADALGKRLQGRAGLGPELQLSALAAKAWVHWTVQSSPSTVTREMHQTAPSQTVHRPPWL